MLVKKYNSILHLKKHWQFQLRMLNILISLSFAILLSTFFVRLFTNSLMVNCFVFLLAFVSLFYFISPKKITNSFVVKKLNLQFQELESSTALLLKNSEDLSILEQLQQQKIKLLFPSLCIKSPFKRKYFIALCAFLVAFFVVLISAYFPLNQIRSFNKKNEIIEVAKRPLPTIIKRIQIEIQSPSYLKKKNYVQQNCSLQIHTYSIVNWQIETSNSVKEVCLIFNDASIVKMIAKNENNTIWQTSKKLSKTGFYQIKVEQSVSDLYQINVLQDAPPSIRISSPKSHTIIDYGQPSSFQLSSFITDDYGIKNATITATIASGKGEGVQFREQTIPIVNQFIEQKNSYAIQQQISLQPLKMQPGDEMYFYITATDSYNQQTKSDIYIVELADTAALMQFDATINSLDVKPEFFRSERQIIIDAEQLLREKDTISLQRFNERSTDLGLDQKLLRLRYGKFLGEEDEENIGVEEPESLDAMEFGDPTHMLEAFGHHHDRAEDATFLDIDTKQRLKAVLNEMWKAELQLRSFKPKEALPFAYKALRLLKDLQQKSRAFVAKTSFKTTPLKLEKRLTADLSAIQNSTVQQNLINNISPINYVVETIHLLSNYASLKNITVLQMSQLAQSVQLLNTKAIEQPSVYLSGFQIAKKLQQQLQSKQLTMPISEVVKLQKILNQLLKVPVLTTDKTRFSNKNQFSDAYFIQLQKSKL